MKGAANWGFGSEKRKGLGKTTNAPGPGNYSLESLDFSPGKSKFHMGQKISARKPTTEVPGAGSYSPDGSKVLHKLPAFSMGSKLGSAIINEKNKGAPGPGSYESHLKDKKDAPKFGFGTSKRPELKAKGAGEGPGPGSYKINSKVGDVPHYSMPRTDE